MHTSQTRLTQLEDLRSRLRGRHHLLQTRLERDSSSLLHIDDEDRAEEAMRMFRIEAILDRLFVRIDLKGDAPTHLVHDSSHVSSLIDPGPEGYVGEPDAHDPLCGMEGQLCSTCVGILDPLPTERNPIDQAAAARVFPVPESVDDLFLFGED